MIIIKYDKIKYKKKKILCILFMNIYKIEMFNKMAFKNMKTLNLKKK